MISSIVSSCKANNFKTPSLLFSEFKVVLDVQRVLMEVMMINSVGHKHSINTRMPRDYEGFGLKFLVCLMVLGVDYGLMMHHDNGDRFTCFLVSLFRI